MSSDKQLLKGNEAIAEAAILGGCRCFFGYPITPQNEIPEYMSVKMPQLNGHFVQAESEVAAINMVYGAAAAGARAMTSSSSPGISLKQEGISYIIGARLPCVIVNIMRAGPGLGGILPAQGDYYQSVKGGWHGDGKALVFAPSSVQEAIDITYSAFDKADKYRLPVIILGDGMLGQMMEPAVLPKAIDVAKLPVKKWAATGDGYAETRQIANSLEIDSVLLEKQVDKLFSDFEALAKEEVKAEEYLVSDAKIILTAYGVVARIAKAAVDVMRAKGIKAGLIRPITLSPFPANAYQNAIKNGTQKFVCVELSKGQMLDDVRLSVNGKADVSFYGRTGGNVMTEYDIASFCEDQKF